jgi:alpha-methylacyl-CoA racemase
MTGWGQYGPLSMAAGHDPNYIAVSGALWPGGDADTPPTAPLTLVGDIGGGTMILIMGLLSAYISATQTGVGQVVDAAITDGSAYISTLLRFMHNTGQIDDQAGSGWANFGAPWNRSYRCADGNFVNICALEPKFYQELMALLNLSNDPIFADQWNTQNWITARQNLETLFASRTRAEWNEILEGSDACYAPVLNLTEALEHPHNLARNTFLEIDGITQPAPAPKFSNTVPVAGKIPKVGENNMDILGQMGLSEAEIRKLTQK